MWDWPVVRNLVKSLRPGRLKALARSCEMAKEFPHCEVLGVDLAPVKMDVPSNCKYEVNDMSVLFSSDTVPVTYAPL